MGPTLLALPFPAIDPIAVAIGPLAIRWYALAYIAGLVGGWWLARRLAAAAPYWTGLRQPSPGDIDDLIVWVALGVVLGGRVGYVLFYNFESYLARPSEIFAVWRGGMSFHGGFLGALLALVQPARLERQRRRDRAHRIYPASPATRDRDLQRIRSTARTRSPEPG